MTCAPIEDSDQPGHPPSLIRVFAVRLKKARILSYPLSALRRLWTDWADLSLRWAHMPFCWFCHDAAHMCFISISILQGPLLFSLWSTPNFIWLLTKRTAIYCMWLSKTLVIAPFTKPIWSGLNPYRTTVRTMRFFSVPKAGPAHVQGSRSDRIWSGIKSEYIINAPCLSDQTKCLTVGGKSQSSNKNGESATWCKLVER